jgi:GNAT superfamily N-acetyltransferase
MIPEHVAGANVEITRVDPASPEARWCVAQYFAELAVRFEHGFDASTSIPVDDAELRPPHGVFLMADMSGRPVGCGSVKPLAPGIGYLKRMWIDESVRGQGLGRRMLTALEAAARELGMTTLRLETNRALTGAIALYRNAGYIEIAPFNDEPYAHHWFEKELR